MLLKSLETGLDRILRSVSTVGNTCSGRGVSVHIGKLRLNKHGTVIPLCQIEFCFDNGTYRMIKFENNGTTYNLTGVDGNYIFCIKTDNGVNQVPRFTYERYDGADQENLMNRLGDTAVSNSINVSFLFDSDILIPIENDKYLRVGSPSGKNWLQAFSICLGDQIKLYDEFNDDFILTK